MNEIQISYRACQHLTFISLNDMSSISYLSSKVQFLFIQCNLKKDYYFYNSLQYQIMKDEIYQSYIDSSNKDSQLLHIHKDVLKL